MGNPEQVKSDGLWPASNIGDNTEYFPTQITLQPAQVKFPRLF